jgi:benzoate-CoA ligase
MCTVDLPERLNAAAVLVDSHLQQGRAEKAAILCGDVTVSYKELYERVNRFGNVLLGLGIRMEDRVAIIMPDYPECVYAFFGAIKIGAVAIPMNTLLMPVDYEYLLNDSRAQVLVIHSSLLDRIEPVRSKLRYVKNVIVVGDRVRPGFQRGRFTSSTI